MKKITATLGTSHSDFDKQIKEVLNDISSAIDHLSSGQEQILEYQNKIFLKRHADVLKSPICDSCHHKACMMSININDGTYKSFCEKCLLS